MRIRVYVPIVSHDQSLVPTLKFRVEGQKWRYGKPLPDKIHLPNVEVSKLRLWLLGVCYKRGLKLNKKCIQWSTFPWLWCIGIPINSVSFENKENFEHIFSHLTISLLVFQTQLWQYCIYYEYNLKLFYPSYMGNYIENSIHVVNKLIKYLCLRQCIKDVQFELGNGKINALLNIIKICWYVFNIIDM